MNPVAHATRLAISGNPAVHSTRLAFKARDCVPLQTLGAPLGVGDSMSQLFLEAMQFHQEGQIDQAELRYRQILDESPDHADAMHLLGVVALQRGQFGQAIARIRQAITLAPEAGAFYCNLAEAYRMANDAKGSLEASQTAVALVPHHADAYNHLGLALQMNGRYEDALAAFKEALEIRPDLAFAHNNLGNVYRDLKKEDEALAAYRDAVRLAPNLPLALSNLGQSLLEKGEKDEAERHCREAVRLDPNFPEGLSNLGNVLRAKDNLKDAKECYRRALELRPGVAMIHGNLGQALQQEGNLEEAVKYYTRALAIDSKSSRFETYLAGALAELERFDEAVAHYRRALILNPEDADAYNGLGSTLHEQGHFEEAVVALEEALRIKPEHADAHSNLAGAYAEIGDMERAVRYYREAIRIEPDYVGAYAVLATHQRDKTPIEDVQKMHEFLNREHLSEGKRATVHHGLAHYYDAKKDYAVAAEHAAQGNAFRKEVWKRHGMSYARDEHTSFVSLLIKQFRPEFFDRVKGWGLETETPVFIVGMPRSGTTLLEQILGSHPQMFGAGELSATKDAIDQIPKWLNVNAVPISCLPQFTPELLRKVGEEHLASIRPLAPKAERIFDKMPDNYLWLGFLAAYFPKAKIIYSKRDLHDVAVSCWITNFKSLRWACDQEDIASRIKNHVRLMEHWKAVLPVPMLEVEYERTVRDLEGEARRMVEFCGLDWHPACLAFHESKRTVRTASLSQVRQPVYTKSVARWKNYEQPLKQLFSIIDG